MKNLSYLLGVFTATFILLIAALPIESMGAPNKMNDYIDNLPNTKTFRYAKDVAAVFGTPANFDEDRSAEWWKKNCKHWQEPPAPDEQAKRWYAAANYLEAKSSAQTPFEEYRTKIRLYEAAARKGYYKAAKDLNIIYKQGDMVFGGRIPSSPTKARAWLDYGLERGWAGAIEWLANSSDKDYRLIHLQQASEMGVALAQYQLAMILKNEYKKRDVSLVLMQCAAEGGSSAAGYAYGTWQEVSAEDDNLPLDKILEIVSDARKSYQQAVIAGGEDGHKAAFVMSQCFRGAAAGLYVDTDPIRGPAYNELEQALSRNPYLKFPRLNDVLPLPPATVKEWKGIYSAMDPVDAAYYKNPTDPAILIEEIRKAGLLVSDEYIGYPVMEK